jgi:hypothetical protein
VTDDRMSKKLLELWNEKNNNRGWTICQKYEYMNWQKN